MSLSEPARYMWTKQGMRAATATVEQKFVRSERYDRDIAELKESQVSKKPNYRLEKIKLQEKLIRALFQYVELLREKDVANIVEVETARLEVNSCHTNLVIFEMDNGE